MFINKIKHLIKPTSLTHFKNQNYKIMNKFCMDVKKADLIFYGNQFGKYDKSELLKRENVKMNNHIWSKKDKELKNIDSINVYSKNGNITNSFKLSWMLLNEKSHSSPNEKSDNDFLLLDTSDLKHSNIDNIDSKDNSKKILKKIQVIENLYKKDGQQIAHIFTENDYFSNELKRIKKNGEHKGNDEGSNIFFIESKDTDKKCSHCSIGQVNPLDENKIKILENSNYILKKLPTGTTTNDNSNEAIKINNFNNYLVECNNCNVIQDKQTNQLINISRNGEKMISKSRHYYIPHYLLGLIILNNTIFPSIDSVGYFFAMMLFPFVLLPSILIFVCVLIPFTIIDILSNLLTLTFKSIKDKF